MNENEQPINLSPNQRITIPMSVFISGVVALVSGTLFIGGIYWRLTRIEEQGQRGWTVEEERYSFQYAKANGERPDPDKVREIFKRPQL